MANKNLYWLAGLGLALLLSLGYLLAEVLIPFAISLLLAYLGNPWVERLASKTGRPIAVFIVFLMFGLAANLVFLLLLPAFAQQLVSLYQLLPKLIHWVETVLLPWASNQFNLSPEVANLAALQELLLDNLDKTQDISSQLTKSLVASLGSLFGLVANLFLLPVLVYYFLLAWPKFTKRLKHLIPPRHRALSQGFSHEVSQILHNFLYGQLSLMLVLGLFYTLGLSLIGLKLSLAIGLLAGLASLVPTLGMLLGLVLGLIAGVFQFGLSPWLLLAIAGVFIAGKLLETTYLTQALVADRLGLHPLTVTFALLAGAKLAGLTGLLISLPLAALIQVTTRYGYFNYLKSRFYKGGAR